MPDLLAGLPVQQHFITQLLEHSTNLVFVRDRLGRYLQVSKSYCRLFEKPVETLIGRTPQQVFGEDAGQRLQSTDLRVLEANEALEFDIDLTLADGRHAYRTLKFPLLDELGRPYAVCGIATDVTMRKRQEEALHGAALAVSGAQGGALFAELVRYLTTALGVDGAFLATCANGAEGNARTQALYMDGGYADNIEYALPGTVCGTVVGKGFRLVSNGIRKLYPDDPMFNRYAIEAYAAYPLTDPQGRSIGLIAAVSRRPLFDEPLVRSMLQIFAARAEAELERLRTEDELRASESNYRAIFEASEDAIFVHDWDTGAIVDVNPKACADYGYSYDEMKGVSIGDISSGVAPYVAEEAARRIEAAKAGTAQYFEWHRKNRDGSLHWDAVHLKSAVIGGERRVLAFSREITARKSAEEALRNAALAVSGAHGGDAFRQLVQSLGEILGTDYAFIATTKGSDAATLSMLAFCSRGQIAESFDYPIAGTPCETVIGQTYRVYPSRVQARFPDDHDFAAMDIDSYAGFPLNDPQGNARGIIAVAGRRPITNPDMVESILKIFATRASAEIERERAEQELHAREAQLRQAQKMEAIGHLTGGIAHDFNNILTSILGYLMLASEHQEKCFDDDKLARYLEEAQGSAQRARDLIQHMLTYSRGQRGAPRPLNMSTAVNEGLRMLRATLPATVELATRMQTDVSTVMLDPVHLSQIVLNLCINARDAMGGSGKISVKVAPLALEQAVCASCRMPVAGEYVALSVRDTGPGIPAHVQERMFEPFFTTKEVGKGSGMGLATVHGIVHEHGGHVLVDSMVGRGARFRVVFPALPGLEETAKQDTRQSTRHGSKPQLAGRVLVVDDERPVGAFMRDLLRNWGIDAAVEMNPQRAEELVRATPDAFDLVITDQAMPKLTGIALAERLHRVSPDLPILLYTGYGEELPDDALKQAGIRALLRKPVDVQQLFDLLQQHLSATTA